MAPSRSQRFSTSLECRRDFEEDLLHLLDVLEDQCFLLNIFRLYVSSSEEDMSRCLASHGNVFLLPREVATAKGLLVRKLMESDASDTLLLSCLVRGISVCVAVLSEVYGAGTWHEQTSCHTLDDFDFVVGQQCRFLWTRSSSAVLLERVERAFSFLRTYGTLLALPEGSWSFGSCHLCKGDSCRAEILEGSTSPDREEQLFCPHSLRFKSQAWCKAGGAPEICRGLPSSANVGGASESDISAILDGGTSVGARMRLARESLKLRQARGDVDCFLEGLARATRWRQAVEAAKCLNISCFGLVGKLAIYLNRRLLTLACFSPLLSSPDASLPNPGSLEGCALRLRSCLERVIMQKINNRLVQEKHERMLVDPVSLGTSSSRLLRQGIVAKEFLLTFGRTPREVCEMSNAWNRMSVKSAMEGRQGDPHERLASVVYLLEVFDYWLSTAHVKKCFRLEPLRGDCDSGWDRGRPVFLYDFDQLAIKLPNGSVLRATYAEVLELCVRYVAHMHEAGVCGTDPAIRFVLRGDNPESAGDARPANPPRLPVGSHRLVSTDRRHE